MYLLLYFVNAEQNYYSGKLSYIKQESKRSLVNDESFDLLVVLDPVQLLDINIQQGTSNITFLELVEVTLQLFEIISNVGPDINILRCFEKYLTQTEVLRCEI